MDNSSEEPTENLEKSQEEIPELSVEGPCVIETVKEEKRVVDFEDVNLIYKPPRFFRRSIFSKTIKLFGEQNLDKKVKVKKKRPLRQ